MAIILQNAIKHGFLLYQAEIAEGGDQETRESGRIALIIRYPDNHCLVARYTDVHYDLKNKANLLAFSVLRSEFGGMVLSFPWKRESSLLSDYGFRIKCGMTCLMACLIEG